MTPMTLIPLTPDQHGVDIDLMYAAPDHPHNPFGQLYRQTAPCLVHQIVETPLAKAVELAAAQGWRLVIHDALRPWEVQARMFEQAGHTGMVKPPDQGLHVRGVAIDVSVTCNTQPVDMGTEVDELAPESAHTCTQVVTDTKRNLQILHNRQTLRNLMHAAGFDSIPHEWWHYQLEAGRNLPPVREADLPAEWKMMMD